VLWWCFLVYWRLNGAFLLLLASYFLYIIYIVCMMMMKVLAQSERLGRVRGDWRRSRLTWNTDTLAGQHLRPKRRPKKIFKIVKSVANSEEDLTDFFGPKNQNGVTQDSFLRPVEKWRGIGQGQRVASPLPAELRLVGAGHVLTPVTPKQPNSPIRIPLSLLLSPHPLTPVLSHQSPQTSNISMMISYPTHYLLIQSYYYTTNQNQPNLLEQKSCVEVSLVFVRVLCYVWGSPLSLNQCHGPQTQTYRMRKTHTVCE
jgi:hypothetical protein